MKTKLYPLYNFFQFDYYQLLQYFVILMNDRSIQQQELKFVGNELKAIKTVKSENRSLLSIKITLTICFVVLILLGIQVYQQNQLIILSQKSPDQRTSQKEPNPPQNKISEIQKHEPTNIQLHEIESHIKPTNNNQPTETSVQKIIQKDKLGKRYNIPKNLWVFVEDLTKQSFYVRRCFKNIQHFSDLSKFKMTSIKMSNYKQFVSLEKFLKIQTVMKILFERKEKQPHSNLKEHIYTIRETLISLQILNERGGIFVHKNVLFTQNFDWIEQIHSNVYVNKGSKSAEAKYVAFYNINHGSIPRKQIKLGITYEPESYMVKFPSVQPYFLAAQQKGEYLSLVLETYYQFLKDPTNFESKIQKGRYDLGILQVKDVYSEGLLIAYQMVLQDKQRHLNADKSLFKTYAIDYFGLFTINQRYFPKKIEFTYEGNQEQKIYKNLIKYTLGQFQQSVGPLRYLVSFQNNFNYLLERTYQNDKRFTIHPHSFVAKYVVFNNSEEFIMKTIQKPLVKSEIQPWTALPKILWLYWDTGILNSSLGARLCIENLRRTAKASNFQLREVNNSNLEQYLGTQLHKKIQRFLTNKKVEVYPQTMSDFVRIALIAKYGGVYMDASYISFQSFEWIVNIVNYPSQFFFNRYGKFPKVFMLFHPHYGSPFEWQYDQNVNTKKMLEIAYQSNLIIAEPNQQFLWNWHEEHGRYISSTYQQSEKLMEKYGVKQYKWTTKKNAYLAVMDAIRMVIGKKQTEIIGKMRQPGYDGPKSAVEYFGLWSSSGYRGQQKFRGHTNFDNKHYLIDGDTNNIFLWRYPQSYVDGIVGKPQQLAKLYSGNVKYLNELFVQNFQLLHLQVHPQSYLSNYLYNSSMGIIKKEGGKLKFYPFDNI